VTFFSENPVKIKIPLGLLQRGVTKHHSVKQSGSDDVVTINLAEFFVVAELIRLKTNVIADFYKVTPQVFNCKVSTPMYINTTSSWSRSDDPTPGKKLLFRLEHQQHHKKQTRTEKN